MHELIKRSLTASTLVGILGGAYYLSSWIFATYLLAALIIVLIFEWPALIGSNSYGAFSLKYWVITLLYPILPFATLIALTIRYRYEDFLLPLLPFFIAWAADTGGYFVGTLIGRHKMCPTISPGKSWEGFFGSFLSVFAVTTLVFPYVKSGLFQQIASSLPTNLLAAFLLTWISFAGDFMISWLKRRQGLKDAGSLLPGHGGFLDRFDGVLFVVVVIFIFVLIG